MQNKHRLPLLTKLIYGSGDMFGGGSLMLIGFFYLFFMTEVAGLNPGLAGMVLLLGKGWDAVSDPLMGWLSDRTRSRFGRRRIYFLAGIAPIFICFTLLWMVPPFSSQIGTFLFFLTANVLFNTTLTMVMIPYNALVPELTPDYDERSSLTGFRLAFSNIASLLSAAVPMLIVDAFASPANGYLVMAMTFGLLFALPFLGVFLVSFETTKEVSKSRFNLLGDVTQALSNRSFRRLVGVYLPTFLGVDVISAVMVYYLTYVLGRGEGMQVSMVLGLLLLCQTLALPVYVKIARTRGKHVSYTTGALIWMILLPVLWFFTPETPFAVVLVLAAMVGMGTAGAGFSPWAMFPDVIDVDELVTGKRRQGIYSGVMTFMRKISSALALAVVGWMIDWSGYIANDDTIAQPDGFLTMVRFLVAVFPIFLVLTGLWFCRRYPLNQQRHDKLRNILATRPAGTADLSGEAGELADLLYGPLPDDINNEVS